MFFFDRASFSTRKLTDEGFLFAKANIGRPGVQTYHKGIDFVDSDLPDKMKMLPFGSPIKALRPENEVFKPESIKSFEFKPVTNNHPTSKVVDASNVKHYQVGFSQRVERVGDVLEASVLVQDKSTINDIQTGKEQISPGYDAKVDFTPGIDAKYGPYDVVFRDIKGNHIAIVDKARAGNTFRLQDRQPEGANEMKIRVVDGKQIELNDDGAIVFDEMQSKLKSQSSKIASLEVQLNDAKSESEKVKGELDATKSQVVTDEQINEKVETLVKSRIELIDAASKVSPEANFTGKTEREIKLTVIKALGDSKVDIKDEDSDEYVTAVFKTLVATAKPKSKKLADGLSAEQADTAEKARQKMINARMKK